MAGRFDLRHGEAVAIGLIYAAEVARRSAASTTTASTSTGRRQGVRPRHPSPRGFDAGELIALMARDKKALDGLTFVLDGPAGVEVVTGVSEATVSATPSRPTPPRDLGRVRRVRTR